MSTVWIAYYLDYSQSYVAAVGETRRAVIEAVKNSYGLPYHVIWREDKKYSSLIGEFEVPNYSIKSTAVYDISEHDVASEQTSEGE